MNISISLDRVRERFSLAAEDIDILTENAVKAVTLAIYRKWENLAKRSLNATLPTYLQGLGIYSTGRFSNAIILKGVLPNMLEQGASPFDQKVGFSKSDRVKMSADGWYLTIPFRHFTPGTVSKNQMPEDVYAEARQGKVLDRVPSSRAAIMRDGETLYQSYQHKNSIYDGIVKETAQYDRVSQNTYRSFRRVSNNSDPMSWIHSGLVARNFAGMAVQETDVQNIVGLEVEQYLGETL